MSRHTFGVVRAIWLLGLAFCGILPLEARLGGNEFISEGRIENANCVVVSSIEEVLAEKPFGTIVGSSEKFDAATQKVELPSFPEWMLPRQIVRGGGDMFNVVSFWDGGKLGGIENNKEWSRNWILVPKKMQIIFAESKSFDELIAGIIISNLKWAASGSPTSTTVTDFIVRQSIESGFALAIPADELRREFEAISPKGISEELLLKYRLIFGDGEAISAFVMNGVESGKVDLTVAEYAKEGLKRSEYVLPYKTISAMWQSENVNLRLLALDGIREQNVKECVSFLREALMSSNDTLIYQAISRISAIYGGLYRHRPSYSKFLENRERYVKLYLEPLGEGE